MSSRAAPLFLLAVLPLSACGVWGALPNDDVDPAPAVPDDLDAGHGEIDADAARADAGPPDASDDHAGAGDAGGAGDDDGGRDGDAGHEDAGRDGDAGHEDGGAADPCDGIDCGGHGTCVGDGGAECQCDPGYGGAGCDVCVGGYVLEDGSCVPDVCSEIVCVNGDCVVDGGPPTCACTDGFVGDACDVCPAGHTVIDYPSGPVCQLTLPVTDGVLAWYQWTSASRYPGEDNVYLWLSSLVEPTAYIAQSEDSGAWIDEANEGVRFDGQDDRMSSYPNHFKDVAAYTVYFVLTWNPAAGDQVVWATIDPSIQYGGNGPSGFALEILADGSLRARHNGTYSPNTLGDVVVADFFATTGERQLVRVQWGPFFNSHVLTLSNGTQTASVESVTGPLTLDEATNRVGSNLGQGDGLDGLLHEVIIAERVFNADERAAVEAYLKVKWSLP